MRGLKSGETKKVAEKFTILDLVLVARGSSLRKVGKWPAFKSIFYSPCQVVGGIHPRYELVSSSGKRSRRPIQAIRLKKYHSRVVS